MFSVIASARRARGNPEYLAQIHGLLRCAHNDEVKRECNKKVPNTKIAVIARSEATRQSRQHMDYFSATPSARCLQ
jgi:hypothetical protein